MGRLLRFARAAALCALALCAGLASADESDVRRIWQLLDYLAVDYGGAVRDGKVASPTEFQEMTEFAATARSKLAALPPNPEKAALQREAAELASAIGAKQDPAVVAALAKGLAARLVAAYPIPLAPAKTPDVRSAAALYEARCASCHGAAGAGDGPLAARLKPPPVAFTEKARARERSALALYQAVSQGIEGTSMPSFGGLPDADRWALAFFVGRFANADQVAAGERIWRDSAAARALVPSLDALARTSESDLAKSLGDAQAGAVLAYLRSRPEAASRPSAPGFDLARQRLAESEKAWSQGDLPRAQELALSAYLDGVEPSEAALSARDRELMSRVEAAMGSYRAAVAATSAPGEVRARAQAARDLLERADQVMEARADPTAAFLGSFAILAREGVEALLIVVAMLAFLRKASRQDMLPYVHAGWAGALVLGAATWAGATYVVQVSGAGREVTEGLSSLFAAVVLLGVGMWMHQKSVAGAWQKYLHEKLSAALDRKSAVFMFGLSFIAVYREVFETILFYAALWEQGEHGALLAGLVAGAALLAAVAFALLKFSARLPISSFFRWSSGLVAVLAVVLTGKGVAALQEAGWIGSDPLGLMRVDVLGIYPSAQPVLAQVFMAAVVAAAFLWNARSNRTARG